MPVFQPTKIVSSQYDLIILSKQSCREVSWPSFREQLSMKGTTFRAAHTHPTYLIESLGQALLPDAPRFLLRRLEKNQNPGLQHVLNHIRMHNGRLTFYPMVTELHQQSNLFVAIKKEEDSVTQIRMPHLLPLYGVISKNNLQTQYI